MPQQVQPDDAPLPTQAAHAAGATPLSDAILLTSDQAQTLVRLVETAHAVHRRYQFFVWVQSQMRALVPHQLMVCGAYQRQSRSVVFDTFHTVVMSSELLSCITDPEGDFTRALSDAWVAGRGQPVRVMLAELRGEAVRSALALQQELGYRELLVHGVSRPQRPEEIESLFIFGGPAEAEGGSRRLVCLDLVLPQLHRVWQRVIINEHELLRPAAHATVTSSAPAEVQRTSARTLTVREVQILEWVRDGSSNQQVAEALAISPLTVKNHIQKILRKLGASNRAQAVARAMSVGLLDAQRLPAAQPGTGD